MECCVEQDVHEYIFHTKTFCLVATTQIRTALRVVEDEYIFVYIRGVQTRIRFSPQDSSMMCRRSASSQPGHKIMEADQ